MRRRAVWWIIGIVAAAVVVVGLLAHPRFRRPSTCYLSLSNYVDLGITALDHRDVLGSIAKEPFVRPPGDDPQGDVTHLRLFFDRKAHDVFVESEGERRAWSDWDEDGRVTLTECIGIGIGSDYRWAHDLPGYPLGRRYVLKDWTDRFVLTHSFAMVGEFWAGGMKHRIALVDTGVLGHFSAKGFEKRPCSTSVVFETEPEREGIFGQDAAQFPASAWVVFGKRAYSLHPEQDGTSVRFEREPIELVRVRSSISHYRRLSFIADDRQFEVVGDGRDRFWLPSGTLEILDAVAETPGIDEQVWRVDVRGGTLEVSDGIGPDETRWVDAPCRIESIRIQTEPRTVDGTTRYRISVQAMTRAGGTVHAIYKNGWPVDPPLIEIKAPSGQIVFSDVPTYGSGLSSWVVPETVEERGTFIVDATWNLGPFGEITGHGEFEVD